jgi:hypothetical protein
MKRGLWTMKCEQRNPRFGNKTAHLFSTSGLFSSTPPARSKSSRVVTTFCIPQSCLPIRYASSTSKRHSIKQFQPFPATMAHDWQKSTANKKRPLGDFNNENEMLDSPIMSPATKNPRVETSDTNPADIAAFDNDSWFNQFIEYDDNPDMRAVLAMSQPIETGHFETKNEHPAQMSVDSEYDIPDTPDSPPPWMLEGDDTLVAEQEGMPTSVLDLTDDELSLFHLGDVNAQEEESTIRQNTRMSGITEGRGTPAIQEYDPDIEGHRLIRQTPRQSSVLVPQNSQRRRVNKPEEIAGFPTSETPLLRNLTLKQICWSYPNHLVGEHLRPFVLAGWTGRMIWDSMQPAAKTTKCKCQKWNKMTKRMTKQRDLMALEDAQAAVNALQGGGMANHPVGTDFRFVPQQPLIFETLAVLTIPGPIPSAFGPVGTSDVDKDTTTTDNGIGNTEAPLTRLTRRIQDELQEQVNMISRTLFYRETDWLLQPSEAQSSGVDNVWIAKALEHEASLIRENLVDAGNLPFDQQTKEGMLNRLRELLGRVLLASDSRKSEASQEEIQAFWDPRQLHVQKLILENELAIMEHWTTALKQDLENAVNDLHGNAANNVMPGAEDSFHQFHPDVTPDHVRESALTAPNTARRRRNRQPPRMFPHAPSPDTPLSVQDLGDLDSILENYPEHLTVHSVMEPFLRPIGRMAGGYPVRLMVTKLRHHHNAKHGSDLNAKGRDEALAVWVKLQREHARRARRDTQRLLQSAATQMNIISHPEDLDHEMVTAEDQLHAELVDAVAEKVDQ